MIRPTSPAAVNLGKSLGNALDSRARVHRNKSGEGILADEKQAAQDAAAERAAEAAERAAHQVRIMTARP